MAYDFTRKNKNTVNRWRLKGCMIPCFSQESMHFSEEETQLRDSPDNSFFLMGDPSSRPFSGEPICVSSQSNYSSSKIENTGQTCGVPPGPSNSSREKPPEQPSNTEASSANSMSVSSDLSASIRSLLQKIRGTCLESLLQRLSSNISASQQHSTSAHRTKQESIPKERLVQILEETLRSRPNLMIRRLPGLTSSSCSGQTSASSESSLLAEHNVSAAAGLEQAHFTPQLYISKLNHEPYVKLNRMPVFVEQRNCMSDYCGRVLQ